jgi:hypothetical protein
LKNLKAYHQLLKDKYLQYCVNMDMPTQAEFDVAEYIMNIDYAILYLASIRNDLNNHLTTLRLQREQERLERAEILYEQYRIRSELTQQINDLHENIAELERNQIQIVDDTITTISRNSSFDRNAFTSQEMDFTSSTNQMKRVSFDSDFHQESSTPKRSKLECKVEPSTPTISQVSNHRVDDVEDTQWESESELDISFSKNTADVDYEADVSDISDFEGKGRFYKRPLKRSKAFHQNMNLYQCNCDTLPINQSSGDPKIIMHFGPH